MHLFLSRHPLGPCHVPQECRVWGCTTHRTPHVRPRMPYPQATPHNVKWSCVRYRKTSWWGSHQGTSVACNKQRLAHWLKRCAAQALDVGTPDLEALTQGDLCFPQLSICFSNHHRPPIGSSLPCHPFMTDSLEALVVLYTWLRGSKVSIRILVPPSLPPTLYLPHSHCPLQSPSSTPLRICRPMQLVRQLTELSMAEIIPAPTSSTTPSKSGWSAVTQSCPLGRRFWNSLKHDSALPQSERTCCAFLCA